MRNHRSNSAGLPKAVGMVNIIGEWLEGMMREYFQGSRVTRLSGRRRTPLNRILERHGLEYKWPSAREWNLPVDGAVGIKIGHDYELAIARYCASPITIGDLGQMLAYSMIVVPRFAFILSPHGACGELRSLIHGYGRSELLQYGTRKCIVARFDIQRRVADWNDAFPNGNFPRCLHVG